MQHINKLMVLTIAIVVVAIILAVGFTLSRRADTAPSAPSWKPAVEGILAVATPCCTRASLWEDLDEVTDDKQRARAASAEEVAQWINDWPYRDRDDDDKTREAQPLLAAQSSEVRCLGEPSGPDIRPEGDDVETLWAVHFRRECTFAKWKIWTPQSAGERMNERHTVWVDEDGLFHGRVDYWK
jgi:hypothetical protein